MHRSRTLRLLLCWLALCALLAAVLLYGGRSGLRADVEAGIGQYLQLALDESYFSSAQNRANDQPALQRLAGQINAHLSNVVHSAPLAPWRDCEVRLVGVDGIAVHDAELSQRIAFTLSRNQVAREIVLGLGCRANAASLGAVLGLFTALFFAVALLVPPPLSARHRDWINYLRGLGYSGERAFEIVRRFGAAELAFSAAQRRALERLHDPTAGNAQTVLETLTDKRIAGLAQTQMDWLLLGLSRSPGDLDAALRVATNADGVDIDLQHARLRVRALDVPLTGTPFFYYAWYALRRCEGEGWITNPASNRPDLEEGRRLAAFMARHGGHARAINDLEQAGLKARTLDQNRSKIKDELVGALGEDLAEAYLFATSRHRDGVHTRYRLRLDAHCITFSGTGDNTASD